MSYLSNMRPWLSVTSSSKNFCKFVLNPVVLGPHCLVYPLFWMSQINFLCYPHSLSHSYEFLFFLMCLPAKKYTIKSKSDQKVNKERKQNTE